MAIVGIDSYFLVAFCIDRPISILFITFKHRFYFQFSHSWFIWSLEPPDRNSVCGEYVPVSSNTCIVNVQLILPAKKSFQLILGSSVSHGSGTPRIHVIISFPADACTHVLILGSFRFCNSTNLYSLRSKINEVESVIFQGTLYI